MKNEYFDKHAGRKGAAFGLALIGLWYVSMPYIIKLVDFIPTLF